MMLVEQTPVADAVLPVAQLKEHLRLGSGFADDENQDAALLRHLRAATAQIEAATGQLLIARDFTWTLTAWRDGTSEAIPIAPVSAIVQITQVAADGTTTTADPAGWVLIPDAHRPVLRARAGLLPMVPLHGSVRIDMMAGVALDWSDLPAGLAQASVMLAGYHYDCRHDATLGHGGIPGAVAALLAPYRRLRLGARA